MATNNSNLADTIHADLQRRILRDEWEAGSRLPAERELAASYGTNRNTLREAIRKLESASLVTVRQGQGVTVTDYRHAGTMDLLGPFLEHGKDGRERLAVLFDLLHVRVHVLEMAVGMAADRAQPEDIAKLRNVAARQLAAFEAEDRTALAENDLEMVEALVDAAHSLTMRWVANTLMELYRSLLLSRASIWVLDEGFPQYLHTLLAALSERQAKPAVEATRGYYARVDATLLEMLKPLAQRLTVSTAPIGAR